ARAQVVGGVHALDPVTELVDVVEARAPRPPHDRHDRRLPAPVERRLVLLPLHRPEAVHAAEIVDTVHCPSPGPHPTTFFFLRLPPPPPPRSRACRRDRGHRPLPLPRTASYDFFSPSARRPPKSLNNADLERGPLARRVRTQLQRIEHHA